MKIAEKKYEELLLRFHDPFNQLKQEGFLSIENISDVDRNRINETIYSAMRVMVHRNNYNPPRRDIESITYYVFEIVRFQSNFRQYNEFIKLKSENMDFLYGDFMK